MIRKYHNHKPQTTLWHREEEPLNHHKTPGRQIKQSNQLSLSHQDDCNTRMDIKSDPVGSHRGEGEKSLSMYPGVLEFHLASTTSLSDVRLCVSFIALSPKSTAMVMVSSPNHTFSWASLNKQLTSASCTYFRL